MFRKRYTVVVVGLGGSSAAQRSEISHFRRERDAVAAAADERDRLTVAHGAMARNYRVLVERDGSVVEEFAPGTSDEPAFVVGPAVRSDVPDGPGDGPVDEDQGGDTGTMPVLAPADADAPADGPAQEPVPDAGGGGSARPPRMPSWDDIPSGPVPDDVLRYFESAVEREEERRRDRRDAPADDEDAA